MQQPEIASEFAHRDVVLFDGQCPFCRAQVERLRRWDGRNRLVFLSLHEPQIRQLYPDLTHEQLMQQMYVVDRKGRRHGGAAAFRYLTRRLPLLLPLAPLLHLPFSLPLWQALYRWVARRRYQLSAEDCSSGACRLHR